jgi:hypothetical protein
MLLAHSPPHNFTAHCSEVNFKTEIQYPYVERYARIQQKCVSVRVNRSVVVGCALELQTRKNSLPYELQATRLLFKHMTRPWRLAAAKRTKYTWRKVSSIRAKVSYFSCLVRVRIAPCASVAYVFERPSPVDGPTLSALSHLQARLLIFRHYLSLEITRADAQQCAAYVPCPMQAARQRYQVAWSNLPARSLVPALAAAAPGRRCPREQARAVAIRAAACTTLPAACKSLRSPGSRWQRRRKCAARSTHPAGRWSHGARQKD